MALLFMEGFEWLDDSRTVAQLEDDLHERGFLAPSLGSAGTITTRTGFQGVELDNLDNIRTYKLRDPNNSDTTCILGFFWRTPSSFSANKDFIYWYGGEAIQCSVFGQNTGAVQFRRGTSTGLGTSSYTFDTSTNYYVEFKCVIGDGTDGSIEMRVADLDADGDDAYTQEQWSITGVDSRNSSNASQTSWDSVRIWGINNDTRVDDIYICDTSGSVNNDYLDNVLIQTIRPDGAGNVTELSPSAGSNFQNVDETGANDGDTTYNTADGNGETDLYTMTSLANDGDEQCFGVQVHAYCRTEGGGDPRKVRLPIRSGSTTSEGSDLTVLTHEGYVSIERIIETNPDGGGEFTSADINSLECGVKRQS